MFRSWTRDLDTIKKPNRIRRAHLISDPLDQQFLPQRLFELSNVRHLRVGWYGIETIPDPVFGLIELRSLEFLNCPIASIPHSICHLKRLKRLVIRGSNLRSLPDCVAKLTRLAELDVANNRLEDIPDEVFRLPRLKYLCLHANWNITVRESFFENRRLNISIPSIGTIRAGSLSKVEINALIETIEATFAKQTV